MSSSKASIIKSSWQKTRGYYVLVRYDRSNPARTLWAKTKSVDTAVNLLKFGYLGTSYEEAAIYGIKMRDIAIF